MNKQLISSLFFMLVMGFSVMLTPNISAQSISAQSLPDREVRERFTLLEQKIDETRQQLAPQKKKAIRIDPLEERMAKLEAAIQHPAESHWSCSSLCTGDDQYHTGKQYIVTGEGNTAKAAYDNMYAPCIKTIRYGVKMLVGDSIYATVLNACVKD